MRKDQGIIVAAGVGMTLILAFQICRLFAGRPGETGSAPADGARRLRVVFFQSPTCEECMKVKKALPDILPKYGDRIRLETKDVKSVEGFVELSHYEDHYHVAVPTPPAIFVGRQCLKGAGGIIGNLDRAIGEELAAGSITYDPAPTSQAATTQAATAPASQPASQPADNDVIRRRFENLGVGAVIGAGLLDGVNPCAFTTIVFLLSTLAYLGKSRRQLAVVGIGFTAAIFLTYFVLGLGLLTALNEIKESSVGHGVSTALAYFVADLAFLFAIWSLVDFIGYVRSKDVKAMTLGLPKAVKSRIHKVIRVGLSTRGLLVGSLAVGFVVAILESLCTGQVYAPIIMIIQRRDALRAHAIAYLLLYNLMFILPLVAILIVAYKGVGSEKMGEFLRRHLAPLKLALALLFAGLGTLVLMTV